MNRKKRNKDLSDNYISQKMTKQTHVFYKSNPLLPIARHYNGLFSEYLKTEQVQHASRYLFLLTPWKISAKKKNH